MMVSYKKYRPPNLQIIDFGISQRYNLQGDKPSVRWVGGQVELPEVGEDFTRPYDPFRADIYALAKTWYLEMEPLVVSLLV